MAPPTVTPVEADKIDATFKSSSVDLVNKALGSRILSFSDEWFAGAENLTTPTPPIRKPGVFTYAGAWYDGWETRRHNPEPFDWVVIRLGVASGKVRGVEIDTAFFNGNQAPEIAVEGCFLSDDCEEEVKGKDFKGWETILPKQECQPSQRHGWLLSEMTEKAYTHVRLQMFPDGGIARFRLYGDVVAVLPQDTNAVFDLAATVNGGVAVQCSDQHFGTKDNLLLPGRGVDMGDGWETKRSRGEHIDWVIVKLGVSGIIEKLVVDTAHFRGNFPQKVQVFAAPASGQAPGHEDNVWTEILAPQKTGPDHEHEYGNGVLKDVGKAYGFVKMVIIPDGGVKRRPEHGKRRDLSVPTPAYIPLGAHSVDHIFTNSSEQLQTQLPVSALVQHDSTASGGGGTSLTISNCSEILDDCHLGDSISVNGTCLTVTEFNKNSFKVGVAPETLRRTNLGSLKEQSGVNLERAVSASTRMGGHFVQGHVDTVATILETKEDGNAITFRLQPRDKSVLRYIVEKGFITLDGASLTITAVNDDEAWWEVMLIAYTQEKVVMGKKRKGEDVNVEVDQVGKYVEKSVAGYFEGAAGSGGAMLEKMVQRIVDARLQQAK
ncbi:Hypothetical protein R9X50_00183100 [Acrodontium crateriforme]|uniref:Riboflavin synthase n=1 Tax=Acrodontium crateriforme TaxID=150365 RepID=A0AAQ3M5V3_9PEZI|nr:Hypothetical protein R9X50_00183100 [Acrodontium crateriforme]